MGKVIPEKDVYEKKDEVHFECNSGYRLEGENKSRCISLNNWSNPVPRCLRNAALRQQVKINTIMETFQKYKKAVVDGSTSQCISLHSTSKNEWLMIDLGENYLIINVIVVFEKNLKNIYNIAVEVAAEINDSYTNFNHCNTFDNENGSRINKELYCKENSRRGRFVRMNLLNQSIFQNTTEIVKICEVEIYVENLHKECPLPDRLPNCKVQIENDVAKYSAKKGFLLTGENGIRYCQDGNWTGEAPPCIQKNLFCDFPENLMNSKVHPLKKIYYEGEEVKISCEVDFMLFGPNVIKCIGNAAWNAYPICRKNLWKKADVLYFNTTTEKSGDDCKSSCHCFNETSIILINFTTEYFVNEFRLIGKFENKNEKHSVERKNERNTATLWYHILITVNDEGNWFYCIHQRNEFLSDLTLNKTFSCSSTTELKGDKIKIEIEFSKMLILKLCEIFVFEEIKTIVKIDENSDENRNWIIFLSLFSTFAVFAVVIFIGLVSYKCRKKIISSNPSLEEDSKENKETLETKLNFPTVRSTIYEMNPSEEKDKMNESIIYEEIDGSEIIHDEVGQREIAIFASYPQLPIRYSVASIENIAHEDGEGYQLPKQIAKIEYLEIFNM